MKKKYLVFGIWAASSLYSFGQQKTDTAYQKKKLSKTDIQIVYSHYLQRGNHSAITGGIGTEKMTVFSPDLTIKKTIDSFSSYTVNTGVDIVSSASVDKIDFVMSSASRLDGHGYLNVNYRKKSRNNPYTFGGGVNFAVESDYLSAGFALSASHASKDQSREITADFEAFFDDLRWGHLNGVSPRILVYPEELRFNDWFRQKKRHSYNLSLGLHQTVNRKLFFALFPGISYQRGLLSTPFHRVYYKDSSVHVENLPANRLKVPIGIQVNAFIGGRTALRNFYRFYWDDWGIIANSLQLELPVKISPSWTIAPLLRLYAQTAAKYFKPYRIHEAGEKYYTSDYDLSQFQSFELGLETRLTPLGNRSPYPVNKFGFRYSFYKRSDGLFAHMLTFLLDFPHKPRTPYAPRGESSEEF